MMIFLSKNNQIFLDLSSSSIYTLGKLKYILDEKMRIKSPIKINQSNKSNTNLNSLSQPKKGRKIFYKFYFSNFFIYVHIFILETIINYKLKMKNYKELINILSI